MSYFQTLLELFGLLLLCMLIGRRLVDLLPNVMQRVVGFYVAPALGMAVLLLIATAYGWISAFKFQYSISIAAALVIFSLYFEKKKRQLVRDFAQLCIFSVFCSFPVLASIIHFGGYNPLTDIFTYLVHSQWLQIHSFSEKAIASGYYPALTQVSLYQAAGIRMGGSFFFAYVQSLLAIKWSYYAYIPTIALALVTGCLALGGIIRQVIPLRKFYILLLALLPSFSLNGFGFGAEWGFFPQTMGLAFAAGLSAMFPFLITIIFRGNYLCSPRLGFYTIPAAICTAAFLFAYNEPFPLFAAAMGLFVLATGLIYKDKIKQLICILGFYLVELLILINYEAVRIVKNLLLTLHITQGGGIGWPIMWKWVQFLAQAFGMKSAFNDGQYKIDRILSIYIFPVIFLCVVVQLFLFIRAKKKNNLTLIFIFCVEFILLMAFIKFRYLSPSLSSEEIGHTFLQFKVSKYSSIFSLALLGIVLAIFCFNHKKLRPFLVCCYLAIAGAGFYWHYHVVSYSFNFPFLDQLKQKKYPFEKLLQLRNVVEVIPKNEVIYLSLGEEYSKLRQMVAYVLIDRKLSSNYRDDCYILGQLPTNEVAMPLKNANWVMLMKQGKVCEKVNLELDPFILQKTPFSYIKLEKTESKYNMEFNDKENWNWVNDSINFYYNLIGSKKVKFKFQIKSIPYARNILIEIKNQSGKSIAKYRLLHLLNEKLFESPWIKINSGHFILHIEADGRSERLSQGDPRQVKFVISGFEACLEM